MRNIITVSTLVLVFSLSGVAFALDGGALFKSKGCVTCHGDHGQGMPGLCPKLQGSDFIKGPADPIKQVILNGRAGSAKKYKNIPLDMPKLGLSEAEADAIVKFLKSL